jgi:DNA topoisomerase-1
MNNRRKTAKPTSAPKKVAQREQIGGFFYEISRRPRNRRQKIFVPMGTVLRTPSGIKVPPAWTNVWMTTDPASPMQAIGRDSKGRRVYLYSAEHMGRAAAAKFSRLKSFDKAYPSLIRKVGRDMKTSEEARVLYLISKTGFRIGSNSETMASVKAFGASTLRCSHVSIEEDRLSFNFIGKKGIPVSKVLRNNFLAREVARNCDRAGDQPIFRTSDDEVRAYLNSIQRGSNFTVKDFRTYVGTRTAFHKIRTLPVPKSAAEFKRLRKQVGEAVAKELGNSPTIALNSYVAPEVFCLWESSPAALRIKAQGKPSLANAFLDCIHYDQEVSAEECVDSDPLELME